MKLFHLTCALAPLLGLASAGPKCVTQWYANKLVARYAAVIAQQPSDLGDPSTTAEAIAAPGYMEYSDSANTQIGIPLGAPTSPNKQTFVTESQANPPLYTETLGVFVACNVITWQWVACHFGSGVYEVKGIHVFKLAPNGQIAEADFEIDIIAGALDTGYTILDPSGKPLQVTPQSQCPPPVV